MLVDAPAQTPEVPAAAAPSSPFASRSVPRHLARGAVGLGLLVAFFVGLPLVGAVALVALPLAVLALRGCPTCWMVGLAATIAQRDARCAGGACQPSRPASS